MVYWYDFVFSPPGFYGKDMTIDILSALVLFMIGIFAFRNYLLDRKNKRHLILSAAFVLLGGSFLIKTLTNIISHSPALYNQNLSLSLLGIEIIKPYTVVPAFGFLLYSLMTLFGFYVLYALTSKDELSMNYVIIAYFILISTYFTRFNYHLLYLTAFLFVLATTRRYFLAYKKNNYKNTLLLGISFCVITVSQFIFMLTGQSYLLYIIAEIVQLVGYLFLLYTFILVLRNARKTKQN
jgi:hypothetical protein